MSEPLARLLSFAAAPTFAVMALLTGVLDAAAPAVLCSATLPASPVSAMVVMYTLMSAFHSAPWLRFLAARRKTIPG